MSELMTRVQNGLSFEDLQKQASLLLKSGFLPKAIETPEQALTIMLTGKELGLGMMESLRSINVIQGKPCMSAQLLIALCYRSGKVEQAYIKESTTTKAVYVLKRKGQPAFESIFTWDEADKACFSKSWDKDKKEWKTKDNWIKQPATMLLWRAMSKAARFVFPDAVSGVYTEEEIAEDVVIQVGVDDKPTHVTEIITHEPKQEPSEPSHSKPSEPTSSLRAEDFPEDQLPNWVIPIGKYQGKRLAEVYADKNETGKPRGKEYLQWMAGNWKDEKQKSIVTRFLEMIENPSLDVS